MITWIAGAPHNGSTLLRQIIKQCFGFPTYSRYCEEELEFMFPGSVGFSAGFNENVHVRLQKFWESTEHVIIKTHELPADDMPSIFVVRDGRDAVSALSNFYSIPIKHAIVGQYVAFPSWSDYFLGWNPQERPKTLLVRFEDMVNIPDTVADKISEFWGTPVKTKYNDDFEECQKKYPKLYQDRIGGWKKAMSESDLELFWKCHGPLMKRLGYGEADG